MIKLIIAGGRDFNDYYFLSKEVSRHLATIDLNNGLEIVSGGSKGVDSLGERYAAENGFKVKLFPANWSKYGRSAGPKRNSQMASYASHLIAFWNGESKGTRSMINLAKKADLEVKVVYI